MVNSKACDKAEACLALIRNHHLFRRDHVLPCYRVRNHVVLHAAALVNTENGSKLALDSHFIQEIPSSKNREKQLPRSQEMIVPPVFLLHKTCR